jgi:hypothetical protein
MTREGPPSENIQITRMPLSCGTASFECHYIVLVQILPADLLRRNA